ncbi:MAG: YraN family protein [Ignavibacteriae bacterium]|nr:YraN family protein [Ignavibacteriota bacterium]NOG99682.1 YraN family protein [Ignavibacteriota bacterium]
MPHQKQTIGKIGEDLAEEYLLNKGYKILQRNYRYGHGEIDIIAKDKNILVFIEVKTRNNLEFGPPELAVTKNKQRQIRKIAESYLYEKEIKETDCRIDVIAILLIKNQDPQINHIVNAF